MASFCSNCGAALAQGTPFCQQCGARVGMAAAPGPPPPPQPAPAPLAPAAESPLAKILLIVLGVFLLLGAIGVAGAIYVGYKVKNKVERVAKEYGVDSSTPVGPPARRADPCSFVSKEEAGDIMGLTVERAESGDQTCIYYAQAQQFSIKFDWEGGRTAIAAMKLASGALAPAVKTTENLTGIGDEAILGPMNSMLLFRKGATAVAIDMRTALTEKERCVTLAKLVASRLSF